MESVAPVFIRSLALVAVHRFFGVDLTPSVSFLFTNRNRAESASNDNQE
jgi:hypothetical protein